MLESLKNQPLSMDAIPAAAQKPLQPETPKPLKLMAAKGALPLPPETLILVWYQLSFETDPDITAAVAETVASFDAGILANLAAHDFPESVLDWLAKSTTDETVLEKIILNPKTHDATLMDLAAIASRNTVDLIAENQVRILRSPEIIEKIYLNPAARMATVDKLIALAHEHQIEFASLKALQEAMQTKDFVDDKPGLSDEEFEAVLAQSSKESATEKTDSDENLRDLKPIEDTTEESTEEAQHRLTRSQIIDRMNAPQRVRLALMGSREDRSILLRDTRRIVYMSVIKSPKMSLGEVGSIASSKSMPDEIIGYIAQRRDWIRYYPIVVALVNNPKCPLSESVGMMRQLRLNDLKNLQRSKSIPAQLARQAQMLYRQKMEHR